jgi:hypothetical protein
MRRPYGNLTFRNWNIIHVVERSRWSSSPVFVGAYRNQGNEAIPLWHRRLLRAIVSQHMLPFECPIFHPMRSRIPPDFLLHHGFIIGPIADVHLS